LRHSQNRPWITLFIAQNKRTAELVDVFFKVRCLEQQEEWQGMDEWDDLHGIPELVQAANGRP
jgi:hypothetical protein